MDPVRVLMGGRGGSTEGQRFKKRMCAFLLPEPRRSVSRGCLASKAAILRQPLPSIGRSGIAQDEVRT